MPDRFGKNLIDIFTMTHVVNFYSARALIDTKFSGTPSTFEVKIGARLKAHGEGR